MSNLTYPLNIVAAFHALLDNNDAYAWRVVQNLKQDQLASVIDAAADLHTMANLRLSNMNTAEMNQQSVISSLREAPGAEAISPPGVTITEDEFDLFVSAVEICNQVADIFELADWRKLSVREQQMLDQLHVAGYLKHAGKNGIIGKAIPVQRPTRYNPDLSHCEPEAKQSQSHA